MFSTPSKTQNIILSNFILSSANAFNLDQSKSLSFGKELLLNWLIYWLNIGLIHVFEVVNIRRGPKNGLMLQCKAREC